MPNVATKPMKLTRTHAARVVEVVDAGLCSGLGDPKPGKMCVEAAVCFALGLPHGDDPGCVASALRSLKIKLNDASWSSNKARAKGLRRLAVAQLGSAGVLDEQEFSKRVVMLAVNLIVPRALRKAAAIHPSAEHKTNLEKAAVECESAAASAASAASAARSAAWSAARSAASAARSAAWSAADKELSFFAERVVEILIDMKAPGCKWLDLVPVAVA